jgi:hypothetical protein
MLFEVTMTINGEYGIFCVFSKTVILPIKETRALLAAGIWDVMVSEAE